MYKLDRYFGERPKKLGQGLKNGEGIRPLSVKIKLTWYCNLACVMCSEWRIKGEAPPRPNYFDTWAKLQAVLDDLILLKTKKVHFSGGEPLMSPFLDQAVSYLTRQGLHVSLVSNGTLWSRSRSRNLIQAGLSNITLSIDSLNTETFAQLRGRDSWAKLMQGIAHIREAIANQERAVKLRTNTVLTRENFREIIEYPRAAKALGIDNIRLLPVDDLHTEDRPLRLTASEIIEYNTEIAPQFAREALKLGLIKSIQDAYPFGQAPQELTLATKGYYALGFYDTSLCFVPWLHSLIGADGRVFACCMLKSEKQHIDRISEKDTKKSFREIWHGEEYRMFRQNMRTEKPKICQHCDDFLHENRYLNQLWNTR